MDLRSGCCFPCCHCSFLLSYSHAVQLSCHATSLSLTVERLLNQVHIFQGHLPSKEFQVVDSPQPTTDLTEHISLISHFLQDGRDSLSRNPSFWKEEKCSLPRRPPVGVTFLNSDFTMLHVYFPEMYPCHHCETT